jgi:hypothetical protein
MTRTELLSHFPGQRHPLHDRSVNVQCPAHDDQDPSLHITTKPDGTHLLKCFRGCAVEDIASAAGLHMADLFPSAQSPQADAPPLTLREFARAKNLPEPFLREMGVSETASGLRFVYRDETGAELPRQRLRHHLVGSRFAWLGPKAEAVAAYGLDKLATARERGELWLVEGESDALTAWFHNRPCLGLPGAEQPNTLMADAVSGIERLWIVQETDDGGEAFVRGLQRRLHELGWRGDARVVRLGVKDLSELHLVAGQRFDQELEEAMRAAVPLEDVRTRDEASRLKLVPWAEMVTGSIRPIEYQWPGWVPRRTVTVVVGAGESFKSWFCLLLGISVAAGRPLFEGPALPQGPVVYLAGENAIEEEKRRCQLLRAGMGFPGELPLHFVAADGLNLSDEGDYGDLVTIVRRMKPAAIVIDSAIALSGIEDENSNSEVRRFMKGVVLPLARRHGVNVYLIAHSPKVSSDPRAQKLTDEQVIRGAGDWRNGVDCVLLLRREAALGSEAVMVKHAKCRVGRRHEPIWFKVQETVPERAVELVYGGVFGETANGDGGGVLGSAVSAAVKIVKEAAAPIMLAELEAQLTGLKYTAATARRAGAVVRGKEPWPSGPWRGQKRAIVTAQAVGRNVLMSTVGEAEEATV